MNPNIIQGGETFAFPVTSIRTIQWYVDMAGEKTELSEIAVRKLDKVYAGSLAKYFSEQGDEFLSPSPGIYFVLTLQKEPKWTSEATWDVKIKKTNTSMRSTSPAVDTSLFVSLGIIASTHNARSMISSVRFLRLIRPRATRRPKLWCPSSSTRPVVYFAVLPAAALRSCTR